MACPDINFSVSIGYVKNARTQKGIAMTTYTAPPDQVNGITLNKGDTLTVEEGATVSGITLNGGTEMADGTSENTTFRGGLIEIGDGGQIIGLTVQSGTNQLVVDPSGGSISNWLLDAGQYGMEISFPDNPIFSISSAQDFQGEGFLTVNFDSGANLTWDYSTSNAAIMTDFQLIGGSIFLTVFTTPTISPSFSSESAGTIVYTAEFGSAPSASELTVLSQFAQAQFDYGRKIGVQDPGVYAFEALGVALASSGQDFQNRFGPSNSMYPASTAGDAQFVTDSYTSVFGRAGTAAQVQQFVGQLNYFETLYTAAGTFGSQSNIDLLARGAVYGQMLGIAHGSNLGDDNFPSPVFDLTTGQDSIVLAQSGSIVNGTFGGAGATWTFGDFIAMYRHH